MKCKESMCYQTEVDMAIHPDTYKEAVHLLIKYLLNSYHVSDITSTVMTGG